MTREALHRALAHQADTDEATARRFLEALVLHLRSQLADGENVEVPSLGTFELIRRKERAGRNPRTGAALTIPAATVVNFKPTASFRRAVNP